MNDIVYGGDIMLFIVASGGTVKPLAYSTSANFSFKMDTREISSKDSTGDFKNFAAGKFEWSCTTDGLLAFEVSGTTNSANDIFTLMLNKSVVDVQLGFKSGTAPSWVVQTGKYKYIGKALIESFDISANDNDNATYSISLKGVSNITQSKA